VPPTIARPALTPTSQPAVVPSGRWSTRFRCARNGFTIAELVVVVTIIAILAAVAAPTFVRSLRYHQIESAARRVKMDLEQIRHVARVKSRSESITFVDSSYSLSSGAEHLDHAGATYSVDLAASPFEVESVTLNLGGPTEITFDGYGKPSIGGTIVLSLGGIQRTVTLDADSGQVTISNE
jgi:prepilin-type N-terminal cleavage/methylation domain-containing protein